MPRPNITQHLSLHRLKSSNDVHPSAASPAPSTPPAASRNSSPARNPAASGHKPSNGSADTPGSQGDHKNMGLTLRVTVVKGRHLAPKDKSGTSDPFLVLTLGDAKQATSAVSRTLHPDWNQTFDFPIANAESALLEAVCWDKDRFKKDYMGEFDVVLEDLFSSGSTILEPCWFKLESRRSGRRKQKRDENISGEVQLKFTLFDPLNTAASSQQVLQRFHGVIADAHDDDDDDDIDEDELISTVNSRELEDLDEDDEKEPSDETDEGGRTPSGTTNETKQQKRQRKIKALKQRSKLKAYEFSGMRDVAGVLFLEISRITDLPPEKNMTRTSFDMDPFVVTSLGKKTYRTRVVKHNLNPVFDEKLVFQVQKYEVNFSLNFAVVDRDKFSGNDFVGTTNIPIERIKNLAPQADPETGLYRLPDPETSGVSEGEPERRKRFRLPLSRATSQNNINRSSGNSSQTNLTKLSRSASNTSLKGMGHTSPRLDGVSGPALEQTRPAMTNMPSTASDMPPLSSQESTNEHLHQPENDEPGLNSFELPLDLKNKSRWEAKHSPVLYVRAKYLPYQALRQQFWRAMLRHYDADESGRMDKVELVTMLDTLGSTLHNSTINGFFQRWKDENGGEEVLTMDQAVICLEEQLQKSQATHKATHSPGLKAKIQKSLTNESSPSDTPGTTPYLGSKSHNLNPNTSSIPALEINDMDEAGEKGDVLPEEDLAIGEADPEADLGDPDAKEEHVVEIHECPICHQPRLARGRKTTDADIITHIATCASGDWRSVNNLVMAGFVTSSQAQRKWYSKIITKVSYGGYRLGANSANILVQDRLTGMINEERMSVYVRLGIRLLYKGLKSRRMEKDKIRKLLRSLSYKQGRKYDDPNSVSQIPGFINFHQLNMNEVLKPVGEFKNFNEFFYRALKPDARPCSGPDNPHIVVSPADCRSVVFNRLEDAQRIWVKGREFSVERLLGDAYPKDAKRFRNGALGIARLAPQDYHRFHVPVDGVMGEPKLIDGEYYTVNPMAIRSALDVYGENIRVVVPIDSAVHGRVMVVCIGAMMVGSTVITRRPGESVRRAEELGYFKFGGSTLLLLFEPGVVEFDDDMLANSSSALETLVRVGMAIGRSAGHPSHSPDLPKRNPTVAEQQDAKRRIEGSLAPGTGMSDIK